MTQEEFDPEEGVIEEAAEDIQPDDVPEEGEPEQESAPPTIEDLASDMGWRPQDEWRGDPEKWKPAADFVKSTVDVNTKLGSRLKSMESQISNIHRTNAVMTERAIAQERQRLLNERQEAFETGDGERFDKVDKQLSELQQMPIEQQIAPPETQEFLQRNPWMNTDAEAATWAQSRAGELANQGLGPARQLAIVEREAKQLFPEHFPESKPKPQGVQLSQPGKRGPSKVRAKNFAALPKEAQAEALYYEKKGIPREDYAKTYFQEQEA